MHFFDHHSFSFSHLTQNFTKEPFSAESVPFSSHICPALTLAAIKNFYFWSLFSNWQLVVTTSIYRSTWIHSAQKFSLKSSNRNISSRWCFSVFIMAPISVCLYYVDFIMQRRRRTYLPCHDLKLRTPYPTSEVAKVTHYEDFYFIATFFYLLRIAQHIEHVAYFFRLFQS